MEPIAPATRKSTIKVTHRNDRSSSVLLLQHVIKIFNEQIIKPGKPYPAGSPQLEPLKSVLETCDVKERIVEGVYIYDILPKHAITQNGDAPRKTRQLYYFAGGGWSMAPSSQHWKLCAEFASKLPGISISLVSYPLSPNSAAPSAFPQMMKMYRQLLKEAGEAGKGVILAGDSAGGNIVLCLTLAALAEDESAPAPKALLAISPSCDLQRNNPDMQAIEKHDPILRRPFIIETATKWRGEWDAADPRVTPNMADVTPLAQRGVKVHGVVGGYDMLYPDAVIFRDKCAQAGVEGEWLDWEKQMHCFPLAWLYKLPESVEAKDWILDVLRRS